MIDLHVHLPMHLRPRGGDRVRDALASKEGRWRLLERVDNWALGLAEGLWNRRSLFSGPRATVPLLRQGSTKVALSVLYLPFYEMDLIGLVGPRYGQPWPAEAFAGLIRQLEAVEQHVDDQFAGEAAFASRWQQLEEMLAEEKLALVHCLEGAFCLGATVEDVQRNVAELARHGIAYITVAHLFWRGFATNQPAIPFLSDARYHRLFPQPQIGLSALGAAAVRAMAEHSILVDVTHMSALALEDTFAIMDEVDPDREIPVIASHATVRFGGQSYGLDPATIERVAERNGVVGLIVADSLTRDGLTTRRPRTRDEAAAILYRHIDRLRELTGSYRHIAIGSDLGGFIKPLAGLQDSAEMAGLREMLGDRYGPEALDAILTDNALRVLKVPLDAPR